MTTAQQDRTINLEIELDAPIETVWKALTEADRLKSWFPYDARVEPGVGGSIWLSWGPECEGEAPITIWDPPNRIQQTEHRGPWGGDDSIGPVDITVDYHLESRSGGQTLLRLVHAGMGTGAGMGWRIPCDRRRLADVPADPLALRRQPRRRRAAGDKHRVEL